MERTGREKIKNALEHREGMVPVDFGATIITGMHVSIVEKLRRYLGLSEKPVKVHEPYQMLGFIEEDLREVLGVDTCGVFRLTNFFGVANENWRIWTTPWGQEVLIPGGLTFREEKGEVLVYPQGDADAPPSGRLPQGGFFFDSITRQDPIDESKLDPQDNMAEFRPMSDADLNYLNAQIDAYAGSGCSLIGGFGGASFGDAASVTAPFLKYPKGIRDISEWYISLITRPDYVKAVFAKQCETAITNLEKIYDLIGEAVDVVTLSGTDFGTQQSTFLSADTFNDLFAPYYKTVNDWIHTHTKWKTFMHTDGAMVPLIPSIIECGFDILNPIQYTAEGMDPKFLKDEFGKDLVFWGGGIDTQKLLPFGTPAEVKNEVIKQCKILSPGGGFVFSSVHNILAEVPLRNILAMFNGIREFCGQPGLGE